MSERAARAQEMSQRVAALTVSASGAGGAVSVTVAGSGIVTDLWLDPRVLRWPAEEIARQVLTTMRRAQAQLAEEVATVVRATVGSDTETGKAVVASFRTRFPAVPEEPDEPAGGHRAGR